MECKNNDFMNIHVVSFHSNLNLFEKEGQIWTILNDLTPILQGDTDSENLNYETFFAYKPDIFMVRAFN